MPGRITDAELRYVRQLLRAERLAFKRLTAVRRSSDAKTPSRRAPRPPRSMRPSTPA